MTEPESPEPAGPDEEEIGMLRDPFVVEWEWMPEDAVFL